MKTLLSVSVIAGVLVASVAQAAPKAYQVLRPTDSAATCEVLSTEINSLNAEVLELNKKAQKRASRGTGALGKGLMSGLARSATSFAYGGTSPKAMAGIVAGNAASGVMQEVANGPSTPAAAPEPAAPTEITPQQQRLTHLMGIYKGRPC